MSDDPSQQLYDLAAERCVLGGCLLSGDAIAATADIVTAGDFYNPNHATIYTAITGQWAAGKPTDPIAVADVLTGTRELVAAGGPTYLTDCTRLIPTAANTSYYARIVADRALLRRIHLAGLHITGLPGTVGIDAQAAADRASAHLYEAIAARSTTDLHQIGDLLEPALKAIEEAGAGTRPRGASTGLADLDHLLGGLRPGQLVLIAARPAMGKSVLATDIARAVALRDHQPAIMFSLEMSRDELMLRILAAECSIPLHLLVDGRLDDHDWHRMTREAGRIAESPLYIDDSTDVGLLDIRAKARRLAARAALSLIVIDYLQLMRVAKTRDQREREVAEISRGLKLLAKELAVPVVAVAQLNRGPEARMNKKPHLADLRESGSLEADADVVILLHRPDYYDKASARQGEVDIDVAKNRNGPADEIIATAQLRFARFANYSSYDRGGAR